MMGKMSDIGVQRIIEKQMRTWEIQSAQRLAENRTIERKIHPFVTVSRMVGSEGAHIAQLVGKRLNRPVFDKELLDHIASSPEARQRMADLVDERDVGWFEEILWPVTIGPRSSGRHDYFKKLCETVFSVVRQEAAVFLGRGVGLILPPSIGLRVKIIASLQHRVERFAALHKLTLPAAKEKVERIEGERAAFLTTHFPSRLLGDECHDLIVNTDRVPAETAADMIAKAAVLKEAADPEGAGTIPPSRFRASGK